MLPKQMSFKIVMLFSLVIRAMYGRVRQVLQIWYQSKGLNHFCRHSIYNVYRIKKAGQFVSLVCIALFYFNHYHYCLSKLFICGQDNIQELMRKTKKQQGAGTSTQDNGRDARIDRLTDLV